MADVFTPYETGLARLLERLGSDHSRYADALTLQSRLSENIAQARQYGDTETRRAERAQVMDTLNRLAQGTVGVSFNELCRLVREETSPTIPGRTWGLLALLVLDSCLIAWWGWCLFGHRPNLVAYLEIVLAIVAVLLGVLTYIFKIRQQILLEDVLHRLGTNQGCRRVILALSSLIVIITPLFWPLGWVGKCGPTPTPTSTPTSTSTLTPMPTLTDTPSLTPTSTPTLTDTPSLTPTSTPTLTGTPSPTSTSTSTLTDMPSPTPTSTPTLTDTPSPTPTSTPTATPTPTPTPDCGVSSCLELHLATGIGQERCPNADGEIVLTPDDIEGLQSLSGQAIFAILAAADGCTCDWQGKTNVGHPWKPINSLVRDCRFLIELPDEVRSIYLKLIVAGQVTLFTIKIPE